MMISAIIPVKNEDLDLLTKVITNLSVDLSEDMLEMVIVNDGSIYPDGSHQSLEKDLSHLKKGRNIKFIDRKEQFGVGYSFDRGVEIAEGDPIVLMGSDVFPEKRKWLTDVKNAVRDKEIGCCCSVGLQPGNYDIDKPGMISRYGAKLMYTYTVEDLPKSSPLRQNPDYRDIIGARWASKQSDEPYEISSLMGAFYWTTREFYNEIHGWDTITDHRWYGHQFWGCLESFLSLKAKVYGGKCVIYPDVRAGHVFGKFDEKNVFNFRAVREDLWWWNKLWVAHTMFDDNLRDEVLAFPNFSKNLSEGQSYIKHNWSAVQRIRERNKKEGKLISK
jgi:glycosyltransferase involved in cell wall biosynthesis